MVLLRKSNPQNHNLQTAVEHGVIFALVRQRVQPETSYQLRPHLIGSALKVVSFFGGNRKIQRGNFSPFFRSVPFVGFVLNVVSL